MGVPQVIGPPEEYGCIKDLARMGNPTKD
ncbi:hypothetical protein F383_37158 [Gossypium arboreum]|uniref:Uncharacterized protein n=1 Tax=Gossypium arboreum TaxID=29729 RepID=A0A0B0MAI6_GOSAR|nr:hypothetical protein F383_37158 [Gossypium arboreum]